MKKYVPVQVRWAPECRPSPLFQVFEWNGAAYVLSLGIGPNAPRKLAQVKARIKVLEAE